jgi:hypothetical protein
MEVLTVAQKGLTLDTYENVGKLLPDYRVLQPRRVLILSYQTCLLEVYLWSVLFDSISNSVCYPNTAVSKYF